MNNKKSKSTKAHLKQTPFNKESRLVGSGGASGQIVVPHITTQSEENKEKIEGSIAGSVWSDTTDLASEDDIDATDTTAFPTYVDEDGNLNYGRRTIVGENIQAENLNFKMTSKKNKR
ncbi:hypothetical protein C4577_03775 [Candidatus Parcubacteria bacterium]|nr:MAG: hypothetical protein C4577_03775 [Candidatus Parcubacteria bacterium]